MPRGDGTGPPGGGRAGMGRGIGRGGSGGGRMGAISPEPAQVAIASARDVEPKRHIK